MGLALLALLGVFALIPILIIYGTWAWGVVVQKTWMWFVVPSFEMQPLTFHQAIAISVFIALFFIKSTQTKVEKTPDGETDWGNVGSNLILALVMPWFVLFFNWITYLIFM